MKRIFVFVLSVTCSLSTFAQFTQNELNDKFGAIRAEMVRYACKVADYKKDTTITKIQNQNIFAFYNDLESQGTKDKRIATLKTIIGNANNGITLNGTNINVYKSRITQFKDGIIKGLLSNYNKKKDEINIADFDFNNKINKLVADCEQKVKDTVDAKAKAEKEDSIAKAKAKEEAELKQKDDAEKVAAEQAAADNAAAAEQAAADKASREKAAKEKAIADKKLAEDQKAQQEEQARIEADKKVADLTQQIQALKNENSKENDSKIAELQNEIDKLKKQNNPNTVLYIIIVALIIASLTVLLVKKNKKSKKMDIPEIQQPTTQPITAASQLQQSDINVQKEPISQTLPQSKPIQPIVRPQPKPEPSPKFPVPPAKTTFAVDANKWIVVGASVIGNGHISAKLPCQDNHKYESLGESWGIAIVSDGAGSAEYSHVGSRIVAERGIVHFKALIEKEGWLKNNELPTDAKWLQTSYSTLKAIRNDMEAFAKAQNISLKSLYATVIVVIHTPDGILATHVGDGRAGYKNQKDEWKALITPHKGEEANQTIFLPSDFWNTPNYVMSGVLVPESVVIREKPFAFTLMSDGCENSAWQYYIKNEKTGKFYDPNEPHPAFFDSLSETLHSFHKDKIELKEQEEKWVNFITAGNDSLKNEADDKTMIIGVLYQ